ncbi:LysM peptidoglycan-binding domain-containing protein [Sphingobacterium shayense]|uniref:glucosaminidase domain and LysM peptidoglycan-binding domain-containing protein n=1 Tax=Sphingobacterium shayense TaxID=626343 RepID=UPI001552372C|nr:glucosaminidase domain-containing protein [Sphingobacterium shayense]NQD69561.1 LysM peptidoglycan-binding domain-containing protein [Sphingobacterium shayense]
MHKKAQGWFFATLLIFLLNVTSTYAQKFSPSSYIAEHKDMAQQLMIETGVPASVILGVAFHESAYGNSRLAKHLNNHFGIKGKNNSKKIRSAYKGYGSSDDSYEDFVGLLQRRKATAKLFDTKKKGDYKGWIAGIARSGYSESGTWSRKVIQIIDRYDLDKYDNVASKQELAEQVVASNGPAPTEDILLRSMESKDSRLNLNQTNSHVVRKGDTLSALAKRYGTTVQKLKNQNNLRSANLSIGQRLML